MKFVKESAFQLVISLVALVGLTPSASAFDLSLVSGGFQQDKIKTDGAKAGGGNTMQGGARVGDRFSTHQGWYAQGLIAAKTFEGGDNTPAPDNFTGLSVAGGYRLYLIEFSKSVTPFVGIGGAYETDKKVRYTSNSTIENTSSGLFYRGFLGMRFDIDRDFFFELENYFFDSALFATEKEETRTNTTSTKTERTRVELFAASGSSLFSTLIVFGFKI